MLIRFTRATYKSKDEAKASFSHQEWLEGDGGFDLFVALYRAGHIVCATDPVEADVAILDLDHLTDEEAACVHDEQYLQDICKQLHARRIVRCDSASRVYNKQKLFVEIPIKRDISKDGSVDRAYVKLRERFQALTGIQCDARMDRPAQVTFGVSTAPSPKLPSRRRSRQPTNREFVEMVASARNGGNKKSLKISTEENSDDFQWVPLNMAAYNRKYGKHVREGGRFEWHVRHYEKEQGAVSGHWERSEIKRGARHSACPRLIAAAVYNALYQNAVYQVGFTLHDVQQTVWKTILYQFEGAAAFLMEEGSQILSHVAIEWTRASKLSLEEYYKGLIVAAKAEETIGYTPRDVAARQLFFDNREAFAQCSSLAEAKELAYTLAEGDTSIARKLLYHRRKRLKPEAKTRGRPHVDYAAMLATAPRAPDGSYIVDSKYCHNPSFRSYLKSSGLHITYQRRE